MSQAAASRQLIRWAERGWLRRVRRDLYVPVPVDAPDPERWSEDPLYLADAVWNPCYFTGWTAGNHWGLTEQVFRTIVVKTSQRIRAARQKLADTEYLLAHVTPENLEWGLRHEWRHDRRIAVADPVRTVIDSLDSPKLTGGIRLVAEMLVALVEQESPELLVGYADKLGSGAVFKRLGYLFEQLALGHGDIVDACLMRRTSGFVLLDPSRPASGRRSTRWGLLINTSAGQVDMS